MARKGVDSRWFRIVIVVTVITIVLTISMIRSVTNYIKEIDAKVASLAINDVDVSQIPDGRYTGSYDLKIVAAEVAVSVKSGRIESVEIIEHINGRGKVAETVIDAVVKKQSLAVDAVSGATASSKALLKAIENALTGAGAVPTGSAAGASAD